MEHSRTSGADRHVISTMLAQTEPARWVFAGDSITHGAVHTFGTRDYTELFSERVRFELGRSRDCVIKTGISGWRICDLLRDLEWSLLQHRPHVVSLHFGMNDCNDGEPGLIEFRQSYLAVIDRVRSHCGSTVIVHTPNPVLPEDAIRSRQLPAYVDTMREIAGAASAIMIDHFAHWEDQYIFHWLADAIHPNEFGHRAMAHLLLQELGLWDPVSAVCRLFTPDHSTYLKNR